MALVTLLHLLFIFLRNIKQRAAVATSCDINAWVPQGSTFGPLLLWNAKLFANDTLLFSVVYNVNTSTDEINNDLVTINKWAYQWKMGFNPGPIKQAQEVLFTGKISKEDHPPLVFKQKQCVKSLFKKTIKALFSITVYHLRNI